MKNQQQKPLVCVQCGQFFYAPEKSMPLYVNEGPICDNQCLTAHFRDHINQPHFENLCDVVPLRKKLPVSFVGDNDHAPEDVDRGGYHQKGSM